ncbi:MAG TPA: hypothetical protein VJC03_09405, partial [bacterium]|nr:hypothetical protein [bacterium]
AGYRWADDLAALELVTDPSTSKMVVMGAGVDGDFRSRNWNGSSWEQTLTLHSNPLAGWPLNTNKTYRPFAFSFEKHDIVPPSLTDNQNGDDLWRNSNSASYNIDFNDLGGSKLSKFQTQVWNDSSKTTLIDNWQDVVTGIGQDSYSTNWNLNTQTWNNLQQGTNYVWVKVLDVAGNSYESSQNLFYVKKDTGVPSIGDNQSGDNTWRKTNPGAVYDVDFADSLSKLDKAEYTAYLSTDMAGTPSLSWQTVFDDLNQPNSLDNWSVLFSSLPSGENYISARVYDNAGNYSLKKDAFHVRKDTIVPVVSDLQSGDTVWQTVSGKTYDIDFSDSHSMLDDAQYMVSSSTNLTGDVLGWNYIFINQSTASYAQNWSLDFNALKENTTNWVSVRCFDVAQ